MREWFYENQGQQVGPVMESQLKDKLARSEVNASTLVWRTGMSDWKPLSQTELAGPPPFSHPIDSTNANTWSAPVSNHGSGSQAPTSGVFLETNGHATAGFVVSLIGLFICSIILCPIGLILSNRGIERAEGIRRAAAQRNQIALNDGLGLAKAGRIIGIVGTILGAISLVFVFMMLSAH